MQHAAWENADCRHTVRNLCTMILETAARCPQDQGEKQTGAKVNLLTHMLGSYEVHMLRL